MKIHIFLEEVEFGGERPSAHVDIGFNSQLRLTREEKIKALKNLQTVLAAADFDRCPPPALEGEG